MTLTMGDNNDRGSTTTAWGGNGRRGTTTLRLERGNYDLGARSAGAAVGFEDEALLASTSDGAVERYSLGDGAAKRGHEQWRGRAAEQYSLGPSSGRPRPVSDR